MRTEYCCMLVHFYFTLVDYAISYGIMMCLWKIRTGHCYWFGEHFPASEEVAIKLRYVLKPSLFRRLSLSITNWYGSSEATLFLYSISILFNAIFFLWLPFFQTIFWPKQTDGWLLEKSESIWQGIGTENPEAIMVESPSCMITWSWANNLPPKII